MSPPLQPIPGRPVPLSDPLRISAGAARRPALFPQLFPIPDPGSHLNRQRESELMREETHLPAMVGFVRKHVAQHFHANRPRPSPAVSATILDAAFVLTTLVLGEELVVQVERTERFSFVTSTSASAC